MIGINVGVPAPMAWFPFTGWNSSFFGDLHIQGTESIQFYTQQKMTMTRWFESPRDSHHDPVWKTGKGVIATAGASHADRLAAWPTFISDEVTRPPTAPKLMNQA